MSVRRRERLAGTQHLLKPLISSLGPADQEALQLVEFEGITQVEAAARLGLSVSGMKSRVQRARLHLRTALDECCRIALEERTRQRRVPPPDQVIGGLHRQAFSLAGWRAACGVSPRPTQAAEPVRCAPR
jgi:predicted DNA-binding protein (UPF0251 family)